MWDYLTNICNLLAIRREINPETEELEVVVLLKSLEDLVRLCQKRYLNGEFINFQISKTNNNAIFYYRDENRIEIKYDPTEINRSK